MNFEFKFEKHKYTIGKFICAFVSQYEDNAGGRFERSKRSLCFNFFRNTYLV